MTSPTHRPHDPHRDPATPPRQGRDGRADIHAAVVRVRDYIAARTELRSIDADIIHSAWVRQMDRPHALTVSDLKAVLDAAARVPELEKALHQAQQAAAVAEARTASRRKID